MAKTKFKPTVSSQPTAPRMVYAWKERGLGFSTKHVDAQTVGETLEEIEARHGALRPGYVVEEARPETSALHPLFEWDNDAAAEKFRLHQARQVISSVVVKQVDNREVQHPIHAFVNISQDGGRQYVSTVAAMSDDEKRRIILQKAKDDLMTWRLKYQALNEFAELHAVIDRVAETVLETV